MNRDLRHFLHPADLSPEETRALLDTAAELKRAPIRNDLRDKILGMIFFNPSLRTRVSFEVAMRHLGGSALPLDVGAATWKLEHRDDVVMDGEEVEHLREAVPVLGRYTQALAVRAFPRYTDPWERNRREVIHAGFREHSPVPVINMESALHHPCQGLADVMTLREKLGDLRGQPLVISWAWHVNPLPMAVTNSVLAEAAKAGMAIRLAHPEGWELDPAVLSEARDDAGSNGGSITIHHDLESALPGARAIYMKSWGSIRNYGDPDRERAEALAHKDRWQLRLDHFAAMDDGLFLHCLPVRRGVEVMADVLDSPHSVVVDQAENRLHVQKALLLKLLGRPASHV